MTTYGVPKDGQTLLSREDPKDPWQVIGPCSDIVAGWRQYTRERERNRERVQRYKAKQAAELAALKAKIAELEGQRTETPRDFLPPRKDQ